jgi:hypothetical protein
MRAPWRSLPELHSDSMAISELNHFQVQVAAAVLQGYSLKEIAACLNMKESTSREKLFNSRKEKRPSPDVYVKVRVSFAAL